MTPELNKYIHAWLTKADSDLRSAQRLLEIEPMILDNACFHCQQAVEKSLKAYICYNGKTIQRTHDIDFLLGQCSDFDPIFNTIDTLNMNEFAVQGRYPDFNLMPEIDDAKKLYQLAIQINSLVKEKIVFTD